MPHSERLWSVLVNEGRRVRTRIRGSEAMGYRCCGSVVYRRVSQMDWITPTIAVIAIIVTAVNPYLIALWKEKRAARRIIVDAPTTKPSPHTDTVKQIRQAPRPSDARFFWLLLMADSLMLIVTAAMLVRAVYFKDGLVTRPEIFKISGLTVIGAALIVQIVIIWVLATAKAERHAD